MSLQLTSLIRQTAIREYQVEFKRFMLFELISLIVDVNQCNGREKLFYIEFIENSKGGVNSFLQDLLGEIFHLHSCSIKFLDQSLN